MGNKEIANEFQFLGKIMELHGENPFKTRAYSAAYIQIRKMPHPLADMSQEEISNMQGIGKAISEKIQELLSTGEIKTLERFKEMTPVGIQNLLRVKGLGPKKVRLVWDELGVESPGELLYACKENRLVELKGFGLKTQDQLLAQLEYFMSSEGKLLWSTAEELTARLIGQLEAKCSGRFVATGEIKRLMPIVEQVEILSDTDYSDEELADHVEGLFYDPEKEELSFEGININILKTEADNFALDLLESSSTGEFLDALGNYSSASTEEEIFEYLDLPFVSSEFRDSSYAIEDEVLDALDDVIKEQEIKGVIHNHSTYSDGVNSLSQMAEACIALGYKYLVISDHSQSAFYANGLKEDRLYQQWEEIDQLNKGYADFKIYKSIESDILNNGALDYPDDLLSKFDLIIASIHSNLKMDKTKATQRLLTAIENPYTRILGHPTGRLLLSRQGYPLDFEKVIDACAQNNVVIELNANPSRLDLDYEWIPYAVRKGVLISINPDAHSIKGIEDIRYGVNVARKAFLQRNDCLNVLTRSQFEDWIKEK